MRREPQLLKWLQSWIHFPDSLAWVEKPATQCQFLCRHVGRSKTLAVRECPQVWIRPASRNNGTGLKNQCFPWSETSSITRQDCCGESSKKYFSNTTVAQYQRGSVFCAPTTTTILVRFLRTTSGRFEREKMRDQRGHSANMKTTWKIRRLG